MARQFHFVVMYDEESQTFELDYDTQEAKFNNFSIYNKREETWEELTSEHWEADNTPYNRAGDALAQALRELKPLPPK